MPTIQLLAHFNLQDYNTSMNKFIYRENTLEMIIKNNNNDDCDLQLKANPQSAKLEKQAFSI